MNSQETEYDKLVDLLFKEPQLKTKQQVITKRLCGLKSFDKALKYATIEQIIEKAIEIHIKMPNMDGGGWDGISWAFGNAWREILCAGEKRDRDISSTANLDEMLSDEQISYISQKTGIALPYIPSRERKTN